ncbi:MAG: nitroreductase [Armatimonadetes bacterium]|nr:nitroreductase [Armatimonadota bacterium]NIM24850.1 nitroreductase [Armatimonadota bacterium]NIM68740.1 nitroreductase [Armatimonadota bacterium]NIM76033.1 nitroreductase [Armatimonadota bacterium]NIN06937.1 nitroreductase [Armatimonadota bacterium]
MDFYEAIRCRRSVRSFKPDPVPEKSLNRILEAARCAPSSLNLQPWKFVVVKDPQTRHAIVSHCPGHDYAQEAPVLIVACGLPTEGKIAGNTCSTVADVATAFAHFSLAAMAEGLGTCWISAFDAPPIKQILGVPDPVQVVIISPLGCPTDETVRPKHRKPMSEVVSWEKFA